MLSIPKDSLDAKTVLWYHWRRCDNGSIIGFIKKETGLNCEPDPLVYLGIDIFTAIGDNLLMEDGNIALTTITHVEEDPLVSLQAKIPESLAHRLRVEAAKRGVYPRDLVVEALSVYLDRVSSG